MGNRCGFVRSRMLGFDEAPTTPVSGSDRDQGKSSTRSNGGEDPEKSNLPRDVNTFFFFFQTCPPGTAVPPAREDPAPAYPRGDGSRRASEIGAHVRRPAGRRCCNGQDPIAEQGGERCMWARARLQCTGDAWGLQREEADLAASRVRPPKGQIDVFRHE